MLWDCCAATVPFVVHTQHPSDIGLLRNGGMTMEETRLAHRLTLNERRQLTMTGVTEVVSFEDTQVVLQTSLGTLVGRQLKKLYKRKD